MKKAQENNDWNWLQDRLESAETPVRPEVWSAVQSGLPAAKTAISASMVWISAAAVSVLLTLGIFILRQQEVTENPAAKPQPNSPAPAAIDTSEHETPFQPNVPPVSGPDDPNTAMSLHEETSSVPVLIPSEPLIHIIEEVKVQEPIILAESSAQHIENETTANVNSAVNISQVETISAAFHIKPVDENEMLYFFMAEDNADVAFTWVFSDGTTESGPSCLHRFEDEGEHTITLSIQEDHTRPRIETTQSISTFKPVQVEVPNVFTPNNDGKNDHFAPVFTSETSCPYDLTIFDSNGKVLFECASCQDGWNGERGDEWAEPGTYLYHILLHQTSGVDIKKSGSIYLSR